MKGYVVYDSELWLVWGFEEESVMLVSFDYFYPYPGASAPISKWVSLSSVQYVSDLSQLERLLYGVPDEV